MYTTANFTPGRTIALVGAPASDHDGADVTLTGLYVLEEYERYDRAAYVNEAGWRILPLGMTGEYDDLFVADDVMHQQVAPNSWAASLEFDRWMDSQFEIEEADAPF